MGLVSTLIQRQMPLAAYIPKLSTTMPTVAACAQRGPMKFDGEPA